jgi:ribosomal protein L18
MNGKSKTKPTMVNRKVIKTKSKPVLKILTGKEAMKKFQKEISPKGVATAKTAARKALEKKYPGMFISEKKYKAKGRVKKVEK